MQRAAQITKGVGSNAHCSIRICARVAGGAAQHRAARAKGAVVSSTSPLRLGQRRDAGNSDIELEFLPSCASEIGNVRLHPSKARCAQGAFAPLLLLWKSPLDPAPSP